MCKSCFPSSILWPHYGQSSVSTHKKLRRGPWILLIVNNLAAQAKRSLWTYLDRTGLRISVVNSLPIYVQKALLFSSSVFSYGILWTDFIHFGYRIALNIRISLLFASYFKSSISPFPVGTQRWNNVDSTLIESTLNRHCFNVVCPLGN